MPFSPPPDDTGGPISSPAVRAGAASRSTWVSVAVNLVLTITQTTAGLPNRSRGLVADFVVLFASHPSQKDADAGHPCGHHRFETAASLVLGVLLRLTG